MIIYSISLLVFVIFANIQLLKKKLLKIELNLFFLFLICFVGLRDVSGGDYSTYFKIFRNNSEYFRNFSFSADIGFVLFTQLIKSFSNNFYLYSIVISIFNFLCLRFFLTKFKVYNFLSMIILYQSFIIFLFMGYVRQGLAISILMVGIVFLYKKNFLMFFIYLFISILFHKSALVFLVFLLLYFIDKKLSPIFILFQSIVISIFIYLYYDEFLRLFYYYSGEGNYFKSKGAYPRVLSNIFIIFSSYFYLFANNYFNKDENKKYHHFILTYLSITIITLYFLIIDNTTLADRLNYYLVPLTIILLNLVHNHIKLKFTFINFVSIFYIINLNIWLLYGNFSSQWYYNYFPNTCLIC
jgi:hypothetical protein|tara:strand:- start:4574 stop:5638 length:1065 start_codon:yes stop_codon:yes gene_type:complete